MDEKRTVYSGGIGLVGILTIIFVVCKILGKITWPWIWVLCPIWISWIISIVIFVIVLIGYFVIERSMDRKIKKIKKTKKR